MKRYALSISLAFMGSFSLYGQPATPSQAISIKPANFSNIDLGNTSGILFTGYHAGVAYERLFRMGSHWSWVIPVTFAVYHPVPVTDFEKKGHELYVTPGVKYYLKAGQPRKGWSTGVNLLAGIDKYEYAGSHRDGRMDNAFYGVLSSWQYQAPIGKTMAFGFELGFGLKNTHIRNDYQERHEYPPYHHTISFVDWHVTGIMNVSIGITKWFF